ncbi:hypothetical protein GCM10009563_33060 [Subtercola frigoramans]
MQVQTWDVTDQVFAGLNSLTVELSDGWSRGSVGIFLVSDQVALLAQLILELADGSTEIVGTRDD